MNEIKSVGIVGAGAMGTGIALAVAAKGLSVVIKDATLELATQGVDRIKGILESRVERGRIPAEEAHATLERIRTCDDYSGFAHADLVIEAAAERIDVKHDIFRALDEHTPPHAVLATNTSSLSITWIASVTKRPDHVLGMHFFNPAHVMKLVEVVAGLDTRDEIVERCLAFSKAIGKLGVRVNECASFLVNRLLGRYGNEALYMLMDGTADAETIDRAAKEFAMPMGPIELRDFTGIDIGYHVASFNYSEYGPRFEPAPILKRMYDRQWLGRKTAKGFYLYDAPMGKKTGVNEEVRTLLEPAPALKDDFDVRRLFLPMINEAMLVLQEHIVAVEALDPALKAGLGMRKGPLEIAEEIGLGECLKLMEALFEKEGERFRPAPLLKRLVWGKRRSVVEALKDRPVEI